MTAAAMVRCDFCETAVPAAEVFEPYRGACRCRDAKACEQRQLRRYDPTIPPDDDRPVPPPADAPAGAACSACQGVAPAGGLYGNGVAWRCLDRDGCEQRQLHADLAPVGDSFEGAVNTNFTGAWAANQLASGTQIPGGHVPLSHAEIVALANQEAAGRKR